MKFTVDVDGQKQFDIALRGVDEAISDFKEAGVWEAAGKAFFEIEQDLFQSEGARGASGAWADRSEAYKEQMEKSGDNPFFLPVMQRERILYFSLTRKGAAEQVYDEQPREFTVGTTRKGAAAHMKPYQNRPARPPIDLTEKDREKLRREMRKPLARKVKRTGIETEMDEGFD